MIDFSSVAGPSDDFWYDHQCSVVQHQVENLPPSEWSEFERQCLLLPRDSQERMAYALGGIDTAASARVLLQFCALQERDTVLTAREAVRSLSFDSVNQAALELWPSSAANTTNEILDRVERSIQAP